ncbi:hypothetical protein FSP39_018275 [Pinctada imbricata]|uniref:Uncharacterized protein n=1 Tax=Pinctada imbricata TaxID=66713 RepID=A0AA88YQY8_PINIB|nr:hypothetical protein FSP39_018275 [Pinctada imbricata]
MIETHDEHEMRHLVDALVEISKGNTWHGKKVTKEMIFSVVADLIGAGFNTTASSLKWGILFMASHHEVQERVQKEIDEIVGQHRKPSVLDRKNLQYSEAVVLEILRMAPILPLALPHSACTKTKLLGFTIPENMIVLVNLLSSNLDRQLWRSPTEFKPERFLDQDGNIDNKIADNVMSFGTGRRRCIGEQLARSNIFVFLTSLLQRCKIIQPEDEECDFEGKLTLTYVPNTFKIKVRERS